MDLSFLNQLSDCEKAAILKVLERDEKLRTKQQHRIQEIKQDVQCLRRQSTSSDDTAVSLDKACGRCRVPFGFLMNRGDACPKCNTRCCRSCRETHRNSWLCTLCSKQTELEVNTEQWMNAFVRRPSRRRGHGQYTPITETIKNNIANQLQPINAARTIYRNVSNFGGSQPNLAWPRGANNRRATSINFLHNLTDHAPTYQPYAPERWRPKTAIVDPEYDYITQKDVDFKRLSDQDSGMDSCSGGGGGGGGTTPTIITIGDDDERVGVNSEDAFTFARVSPYYRHLAPGELHSDGSSSQQSLQEEMDTVGSYKTMGQFRSESMTSVYSSAGNYGTVTVKGEVLLGLSYNYMSGCLELCVKQCRDIAAVDAKRARSDPYVKVYLLPDKSKSGKRKTRVKRHTLNPNFEETLKFSVTLSELSCRTLWLSVWHSDMFGRNDFLGEVMLPLGYESFTDSTPRWHSLQDRLCVSDDVSVLGSCISGSGAGYQSDVVVTLQFFPKGVSGSGAGKGSKSGAQGTLSVIVHEARNLTAVRSSGVCDPFCKSYLLPDRGRSGKQKTAVVKKSLNPHWEHEFCYEGLSVAALAERCLELTLWDYDRLGSNDFLGGVRLNLGRGVYKSKPVDWMDSRAEEAGVWAAMLSEPHEPIQVVLPLRLSMEGMGTVAGANKTAVPNIYH